jgi:hypothetical protein
MGEKGLKAQKAAYAARGISVMVRAYTEGENAMVGLEINPPPSGVETPKRKRKRLSEEHRIKIGKGRQKTTTRKHYEKAMDWIEGVPNRAPPEPFAEDLKEIWSMSRRLKWTMTKPLEAAIFDLAKMASKTKRKT